MPQIISLIYTVKKYKIYLLRLELLFIFPVILALSVGGCDKTSNEGFQSDRAPLEFEIVDRSEVVTAGRQGYEIFRIPVIVRAPNGDLLLFCEGRKTSSDFDNIDILLFRSTGEGEWSDATVVVDNETDTAADIAAVVHDGRVHLLYQERPGRRDFNDYLRGEASDARGYHIYSENSGESWSEPVEITGAVLPEPDEELPIFGPNNGIVLDSERIVIPMYYANQAANAWTPAVIYSDDDGKTWDRSVDAVPGAGVNETAVVQTLNDDVYAVARDNSGDDNDQKRFFRSTDRGETWTETGDLNAIVPEVSCQQSMVARGNRIFLATLESESRDDGRLKTGTYDPGQTDNVDWSDQDLQITTGGFAYSSMAIRDSTIHLVYEEKTPDRYASLQYVQVRFR
jgi:sialidase-1